MYLPKKKPGCSVGEVARRFETSRIAVMKHLRVLEEADLIVSRKEGRTRRHYVNAAPIQMIYDRWTTEWSALWGGRLAEVTYRVEGGPGPPGGRAGKGTGKRKGRKRGGEPRSGKGSRHGRGGGKREK